MNDGHDKLVNSIAEVINSHLHRCLSLWKA